jgi:hypothetical protein
MGHGQTSFLAVLASRLEAAERKNTEPAFFLQYPADSVFMRETILLNVAFNGWLSRPHVLKKTMFVLNRTGERVAAVNQQRETTPAPLVKAGVVLPDIRAGVGIGAVVVVNRIVCLLSL